MLTEEQKLELDNLVASMQTKGASNEEIQAAVDARKSQMLSSSDMEKPQPVAETTAPAAGQTPDTGSQLESGSLELQSEDPSLGFVEQIFKPDVERNETYQEREARQELELRNKVNERLAKEKEQGELSATDKMVNSMTNVADQFQQFIPNTVVASNKIFRGIFGDEAVDAFVANKKIPEFFKEGLSEKDLDFAIQQQKLQEAEMGKTGSIVKGFKEGDIGEIAAGIVNGITSIGSSFAINTLTAGGGLATDLIGRSYIDYNETLAAQKGKTISDLIRDNEDKVALPATIGAFSAGLEAAGLKGAGKYLMNKVVQKGVNKTIAAALLSGNKEGLTELTQTGLDAANIADAKGESKLEAFGNAVFSEEGLESYLQGFVGGGILRGGKSNLLVDKTDKLKAATAMRSVFESKYVKSALEEVEILREQKTATKDKEVKSAIDKQIKEKQKQVAEVILENNKMFNSMTDNEIYQSSKEYDKVTKLEQKQDKVNSRFENGEITKEDQNILLEEVNSNINNSIQKLTKIKSDAINRSDANLEQNLETIEGLSSKIENLTFKRFKTSQEVQDYLLSKDKRKTKQSKVLAEDNDGTIIQNADGSQEIIINEEVSKKTGAINVGSHEFLHGVLFKTLQDNPETAISLGNALKTEIDKLNSKEVEDSIFKDRLELYENEKEAVKGEEVLSLFSDATATGDLKFNENLFTKIGDQFRKIFDAVGIERKFDSGQDVYNFIKDYNKDISKGGLRQALLEGAKKGFKGKLIKASNIEKEAAQARKDSRSNLKSLLDKYKTKENLVQQSLLKTPQGQETFDFTKSEFGQEVGAIVEAVTKKLYDPIPLDAKRDVSRNDYKNGMISNLATIVANEYDPAKQDLDKFVSIRAFQRSNRLAKELGIESMVEEGGAGITTDVTEAKAITTEEKAPDEVSTKKSIIEALNIPASVIEKINKLAELAAIKADKELEGKDVSDLKKLTARNKAFNEIFSKQLFNDIKELLGKNTKNSNDFSKYLNKNYNTLLDAALNNIDFQKGGGISADWNTNPPTKEEFIDYYEATDEKPSTRADRKKSLNNAIARQVANEARIEFAKKDPATAEIFKKKHGVVLASKSQFDKPVSSLDREFRLETGDVNKLLNKYLKRGVYDLRKKENIDQYISDLEKYVFPIFPKKFLFTGEGTGMFTHSKRVIGGKSRSFTEQERNEVYDYYRSKLTKSYNSFKNWGEDIPGVTDYTRRLYENGKAVGNTEAKQKQNFENGTTAKFNEQNGLVFDEMWKRIHDAIKKDKNAAIVFGNYFKLVANVKNHPHRLGAEVIGRSLNVKGDGKRLFEFEHAMPATGAYLYLLDSILSNRNFYQDFKAVKNNYKVIALDKALNYKLGDAGLGTGMPNGWKVFSNSWIERYFNPEVAMFDGGLDPSNIVDLNGGTFQETYGVDAAGQPIASERILASKSVDPVKKIRVFDFDDTLAKSNSQVKYTLPDGTTGSLNATEYAKRDQELKDKGAKFDFSEFSKVIDGKKGPLFNVAKKIADARGNEDLFVLTARPADADNAIQKFLSLAGINFKKENIVGLGDGTAKAKADWILGKTKEGYNDFYFADDAIKNVIAVKEALKTVDVKSRTQRALASKNLSDDFNNLLERVKGVAADATYSEARAIKLGKKNNPFKFFVPYSAEDYMGLIYPTLGKGAEGDKNLKWYKENITDVYARGIRDFEIAKQQSMTQWIELKKQIKNSPAKLSKEAVRDFTNEEAIRLYLWAQQGMLPDNVAKKDIEAINKYIDSKPELKSFAEQIQGLTLDGYPAPTGDWLAGTITTDLVNYTNTASREQYLKQWQENVDVVYSKDNMNKLKAIYGEDYTEALSDMLYRMKTGRNRPTGANKLTNQFMNWVNDSVGTIMFFNTRSALLQTISAVNYLNFTDNNPLRVAAAFANQKQYWSDFAEIFNSDFLRQRRGGLKTDVNADEIARAASSSENKVRAALAAILKMGFLPTQLADSFAISIGGAAFYRNRVNSLIKNGLTKEQAQEQAFLDFKETTEESQQSSRPDRVSMQQASPLGRVVLAFANTPMQYTRLTKKAALDLFNGRGDWKTNLSKLAYYGAVQNIIFTALQSAMFGMLFSDEEDDDEKEKIGRIGNGIADTLLRGSGVYGAGVAMIKNIVMEAIKQYNSGRPDYTKAAAKITSISPPVDSKIRKLESVGRTFTYKQEIEKMRTKGFDIDNPAYMAVGQTVSALANIPLDRAVRKMNNLKTAVDQDTELWQSIGLALGYSEWDLGMIQAQQKKDKEQKKADKVKKAYMKKFSPKLDAKTKRIISFSKMSKDEKKEYIQKRAKAGQPLFKKDFSNSLPKGVLGRANKDGTIEVANGLSPTKKKQVIAHEKKHQEDMKSGKLNYDKNFIYWNNEKYKRTSDKKINYKGKLHIEGSPALPWEKAANKAEKQIN
jgi:hypothetical protein